MISTGIRDGTIRVFCSKDQIISSKRLKRIYKNSLRLLNQHGNLIIVVDVEKNVRLSGSALELFNRLEKKHDSVILFVFVG